MSSGSQKPSSLPILEAYQSFKPVHEIMHFYVDLNVAIIGPTLPSKWWTLNRRIRTYSLYELEKRYQQAELRGPYLKACIQKAQRDKATVCGAYLGFRDLFVPILRRGKILGFLVAGAFADHEITRADVRACWGSLAKKAAPSGPEFQDFIRILLDIPVLEGEALRDYQEALELFAGLLGGELDPGLVEKRTQQLIEGVLSKNLPHLKFLRWALGFEASESLPNWCLDIENWDWVRDEVGVTRIPTTVITVIPKAVGKRSDPLEEALRIYRFQRRSFQFAQTLPQTVGGKLENYGAVFVTSADPSLTKAQRAQQIQGIVRRIHHFASRELDGPALVGVGESVPPGEVLESSYRQAVLALHLGSQTGSDIVTQGKVPEMGTKGLLTLNRLLSVMTRQLAEASWGDLDVLREGYLKQVLTLSFQNPVEIRWHLTYALTQLTEAVGHSLHWPQRKANDLHEEFALLLEKAPTTHDMVLAFREALARLVERTRQHKAWKSTGAVKGLRTYVDTHFREPLRMAELARMAGVSVSTFSRHFEELTGKGLELYLRDLRLEEAKRLLKTGQLPVARVAQACGFKSSAYFARVFGKATGKPPLEFRQKFQTL